MATTKASRYLPCEILLMPTAELEQAEKMDLPLPPPSWGKGILDLERVYLAYDTDAVEGEEATKVKLSEEDYAVIRMPIEDFTRHLEAWGTLSSDGGDLYPRLN